MQSAKEPNPGAARRTAERLFGVLEWRSRDEAGLGGQPYVECVAVIDTAQGVW